ncbi:hypothetical protein X798_07679, partial [Onchocerca flexuosa]
FIDLNSVIKQEETFNQNARRIAKRALRNIPWHLIAYMQMNNISANPPIQINRSLNSQSPNLFLNWPLQYEDHLRWNRRQQNRVQNSAPCATSQKHSEKVGQRYETDNLWKTAAQRSHSAMGSMEKELDLPLCRRLSEYPSQRPKPALRRQIAFS